MEKDLKTNGFKEKLFEAILKPLREENLSKEYHYQFNNMQEFHQRFCSLEASYAQAYAKAEAALNAIKSLNTVESSPSIENQLPKFPLQQCR